MNCSTHSNKLEFSYIHNWINPNDFETDFVAVDRVWYNTEGDVVFARRVFRIKAPKWMQKMVFGKVVI